MSRLGEILTDPTLDPPVAALDRVELQPARHRAQRRADPPRPRPRRPVHRRPRAVPHRHRALRRHRPAGDDADREHRRRAGVGPPVDGLERAGDRTARRVVQQHRAVPPARRGRWASTSRRCSTTTPRCSPRRSARRSTSTSCDASGGCACRTPRTAGRGARACSRRRRGRSSCAASALAAMGQPALPDVRPAARGPARRRRPAARYPLQLLTPKHHTRFLNSGYSHLPKHGPAEGAPFVELDAADAAARGIADGDAARVWNDRASVELPVRVDGSPAAGRGGDPVRLVDGAPPRRPRRQLADQRHAHRVGRRRRLQRHPGPDRENRQAGRLRRMAGELIYAFRVMRLPLLDAGGAHIGRLAGHRRRARAGRTTRHASSASSPTASGARSSSTPTASADIDSDGARLRSWDVDLNPFNARHGEMLVGADVIDQRVGDETVSDVALRPARGRARQVVGDRQGPPRPPQPAAPPAELPPRRHRRGARAVPADQRDRRRGGPPARHAPGRRRRRRPRPARSPSAASSPRRWTTSAWPTCSRSCPRTSSCASSRASTSTAWSACSTRWSTTTSPTCSARCPASSSGASSTRWTPRTPTSCAACCPTRRAPPAG